jgi:hypothetical protein
MVGQPDAKLRPALGIPYPQFHGESFARKGWITDATLPLQTPQSPPCQNYVQQQAKEHHIGQEAEEVDARV